MELNKGMKEELAAGFETLAHPVRLVVFTQEQECRYCEETRLLAEEVAAASTSLSLDVYDFLADAEKAAELGVDKIPALAVIGEEDYGIRFYGYPTGYEFTSLVEAVKTAGSDGPVVSADSLASLRQLDGSVHAQVLVTPT
jgi:alkyl hydroperoxide reductase subunit AhpF